MWAPKGMSNVIKTYDTDTFTAHFVPERQELLGMMKQQIDLFFIMRVEEMFRMIRLPVPPNRATIHTIIFLTDGEANMTIGSENCTIRKGECMVVPAGQVFSFHTPDINTGFICGFRNDFILHKFSAKEVLKDFAFLGVWGNPVIQPDTATSVWMEQLLLRILSEYQQYGLQYPEILQSCLINLLYEINRAGTVAAGGVPSQAVQLTNRFMELVNAQFATLHLVSEYARLLNVTPNHLNKSVKSVTGKSPTKWIDEAIVLEAKVLLCQTPMTIGEIAASTGIFDASYFSRLFKKHTGMTPLQFRQMIEKS